VPTVEKFNKTEIAKIKLPAKDEPKAQVFYWERQLKGFGIKATPTGLVYVVQKDQRTTEGTWKTVRVKIGKVNELPVDGPDGARERARKALVDLGDGIQLNEEKRKVRIDNITLRQVFEDYCRVKKDKLRPKTLLVYESAMRRCFFDDRKDEDGNVVLESWANKPITKITRTLVQRRHQALSNAHGPRGKGEAQANQAMRTLRTLFGYAMLTYRDDDDKPVVSENPVKYLSELDLWNEDKCRSEIIEDNQLAAWYKAVMGLESRTSRDYLLLLLFTGLRRTEAVKLRWERIKLDGSSPLLRIPKEDTKTKSAHELPLSDVLVGLLRDRKSADFGYVFPGEKADSHLIEPKRAIEKVIKESKVVFTLHTLRRTFETIAARLDIPYFVLKKLLNHSTQTDITSRYVNLKAEDLRPHLQKIADFIKDKAGIESIDELDAKNA
jgi:integrase